MPSEILKRLSLSVKSAVNITLEGENIVIKVEPRQGWATAAMKAHEQQEDNLLIPDVFEDDNLEDWTW